MKPRDTFQSRLEKIMQIRNIKPVELHEKTGISESLLSKYLSGNAVARQKKLSLLADALNTNEVWLMGYDVSQEETFGSLENNTDCFEFIAEDDAMFPAADVGDKFFIFKQNKIDDVLTSVKGVYLIILDEKKTVRKIELNTDNTHYNLVALNPFYKVVSIPKAELYNQIQILGKVLKSENISAFK